MSHQLIFESARMHDGRLVVVFTIGRRRRRRRRRRSDTWIQRGPSLDMDEQGDPIPPRWVRARRRRR